MADNDLLRDVNKQKFEESTQNMADNEKKSRFSEQSDKVISQEKTQMYNSLRDYTGQLHTWLYQYRMWCNVNSVSMTFPMMFSNNMPQTVSAVSNNVFTDNTTSASTNSAVQPPRSRENGRVNGTSGPNRNFIQGVEYALPPLWKRVAAEIIDFVVLFYLKVMLTVLVLRHMGYLRDDNLIEVPLDIVPKFDITEMDVEKAFSLTSEIIALEVVNRIMITVFETLCLYKGIGGMVGGATPGKRILGMKVVSCEHANSLRNGRVIVCPARNVGFLSALVRSVIKNFTMAFFFPACLTVFFFQHNRAAYDILAKTIVVESVHPLRQL